MRFIGNKENLLDRIYFVLSRRGITGKTFFDFFSGTTSVARFFKRKGYKVFSSDLLYLSYCLQRAYVTNNAEPKFAKLLPIIGNSNNNLFESMLDSVLYFLNEMQPVKGFIYENYSVGGTKDLPRPRMYLSDENAKKIDAIRQKIEEWHIGALLSEDEYFILLACLVESVGFFSNISGVYAAFQKQWDARALKPFIIKPIELVYNKENNRSFHANSMDLIKDIDTDILYLDPPYNERQYAPNYHLLETIAKYDSPQIHGITGMRDYSNQKSSFCNKGSALRELDIIAKTAKYKYLILSYNTEGIMPQKDIKATLGQYGDVEVVEFEYLRFKSNNNGESKTKKHVHEQLYILKKV